MPNTHLLAAICDRAADKRDIDCAVGAGRQRVKAFVKYDEASGKEDGGGLDRRRADRPAGRLKGGRMDRRTDRTDSNDFSTRPAVAFFVPAVSAAKDAAAAAATTLTSW